MESACWPESANSASQDSQVAASLQLAGSLAGANRLSAYYSSISISMFNPSGIGTLITSLRALSSIPKSMRRL